MLCEFLLCDAAGLWSWGRPLGLQLQYRALWAEYISQERRQQQCLERGLTITRQDLVSHNHGMRFSMVQNETGFLFNLNAYHPLLSLRLHSLDPPSLLAHLQFYYLPFLERHSCMQNCTSCFSVLAFQEQYCGSEHLEMFGQETN